MHRVAIDVLSYGGKCWLILVDMYSGFPLVRDMGKRQDAQTVIRGLTRWFHLLGWPSTCRSDFAPTFHDTFSQWARARPGVSNPTTALQAVGGEEPGCEGVDAEGAPGGLPAAAQPAGHPCARQAAAGGQEEGRRPRAPPRLQTVRQNQLLVLHLL